MIALGGLLALVGIIVFFSGGDDSDEGDSASTTTEAVTSTSESSTTESTNSTTPTETVTTSTSTTTTVAPVDEVLEQARMAVGTYEGGWTNLTFGSTGPVRLEVTLDETTLVLTVTIDLGGNVFGGSDPPPITVDIEIDDASSQFSSPLFGGVTATIADGNLMLSATNIPAPGIARMDVSGLVASTGSDLQYLIEFDDGSTAEGTASLGPVSPPADTTTETPSEDVDSEEGDAAETVEGFFAAYVAAIDAGDADFLFDRLHPVVLEQPTADLCRAFIEREILALSNYRITDAITGPTSQTIAGTAVADVYSAPVEFVFQGQTFEGTATFAAVDGQMRWFTECR